MAVILHGSCSIPHTHSHSHPHPHDTPAKTKYQRLPSNKHRVPEDRSDYDGLTNNNTAVLQLQQQQPSFIINGSTFPVHSDGVVCAYRSPNHSRTNSFSNGVIPPLRSNSFRSMGHSEGRPAASVRLDDAPDENDSRYVPSSSTEYPQKSVLLLIECPNLVYTLTITVVRTARIAVQLVAPPKLSRTINNTNIHITVRKTSISERL